MAVLVDEVAVLVDEVAVVRGLPEVGEERVSWVAGRAHSCTSLVLVVVKTSHFTATRWADKITAPLVE